MDMKKLLTGSCSGMLRCRLLLRRSMQLLPSAVIERPMLPPVTLLPPNAHTLVLANLKAQCVPHMCPSTYGSIQ